MREKAQYQVVVRDRIYRAKHDGTWGMYWDWFVDYRWWGYHRAIATTQERRANKGHRQEFREERWPVKFRMRTRMDLPNAWDDLNFGSNRKSWKDRTRCRRQWEVNLPPRNCPPPRLRWEW